MFSYIALLSTFALGALAQSTTTVNLFGVQPGFAGSVIGVDASRTTYALVCTSGASSTCVSSYTVGIHSCIDCELEH